MKPNTASCGVIVSGVGSTRGARVFALFALFSLAGALAGAAAIVRYQYDLAGQLISAYYDLDGTNSVVAFGYDAVGNTTNRITIGPADMAFDSDADGLPDLAELRYFGHLNETGAGDPDADGLSNSKELAFGSTPILKNTDGDPADDYAEWIADTNPTNAASYFRISALSATPPIQVFFLSSPNRVYTLQSAANLMPGSWQDVPGQTRVPGSGDVGVLTDTNSAAQQFYRVRVEWP